MRQGKPCNLLPARAAEERRRFVAALARVGPRLAPLQALRAVAVAVQQKLQGSVIAALAPALQRPGSAEAIRRSPRRVAALLEQLATSAPDARELGCLGVVQQLGALVAEDAAAYGDAAMPLLCALARAGGNRALKRLPEDGISRLVGTVCEQSGLLAPGRVRTWGAETRLELLPGAKVADSAALLCALNQLGHRDSELISALTRHVADHIADIDPALLPSLARALHGVGGTPSTARGGVEAAEDFVLLHGLARRGAACAEALDAPGLVALLQAFGRHDVYDEEFLEAAGTQLRDKARSLSVSQLGDAMYALGYLKVSDADQLDAMCDALRPRAQEISEADLVRFMRGLVKLRHCNPGLLSAFEPVIERTKMSLNSNSLTNLINCFSFFETTNEKFFISLLHAATSRMQRLNSMSVQHILTALCRQQGRLDREAVMKPVERICAHMTTPAVAAQLSLQQAVASLTALAKLQHQDLAACAVVSSALMGRSTAVVWTWAPSVYFHAHRPEPSRPLIEKRALDNIARFLDSNHCIDVLRSLHRLDLHSDLASRLSLVFCSRLMPQLHELRAREVLIVARALSACRHPCEPLTDHIEALVPTSREDGERAITQATWRERVLDKCFEGLRRHEHWLESSWFTLLPFKLLCLEIETGVYGTRKLCEVLSPTLFNFVDRLRQVTHDECEANRLRREGAEDEAGAGAAAPGAAATAAAADGAADRGAALESFVQDFPGTRLSVNSYIHEMRVDFLIEAV